MKWGPSPSVPDVILPVQFHDQRLVSDTPERRLIFAVLMDAIVQLQRGDSTAQVAAERWIRDESKSVPISFTEACEVLGFEARNLARGILSWRAQPGVVLEIRARPIPGMRRRVTAIGRTRRV